MAFVESTTIHIRNPETAFIQIVIAMSMGIFEAR